MKAPTFRAPSIKRPTLPSLVRAKDPLKGVPDTGDVEADSKAEISALEQAFRDRAKEEAARFQGATDTGYYFCIVLEDRAQCDALLAGLGVLGRSDLFVDGRDIAAKLGIELPAATRKPSLGKIDRVFAAMAKPFK